MRGVDARAADQPAGRRLARVSSARSRSGSLETRKNTGDVNLASLPCWRARRPRPRPATRSSRSARSTGARRSISPSTRPRTSQSSRWICRPQTAPKFALAPGERAYVEKPRSGRRFLEAAARMGAMQPAASRSCSGISATFDWSAHVGRAGLVFVDGSHAHDYVIADTGTAFRPGRAKKAWSSGTTTVYGRASPAHSRRSRQAVSSACGMSAVRAWWSGKAEVTSAHAGTRARRFVAG